MATLRQQIAAAKRDLSVKEQMYIRALESWRATGEKKRDARMKVLDNARCAYETAKSLCETLRLQDRTRNAVKPHGTLEPLQEPLIIHRTTPSVPSLKTEIQSPEMARPLTPAQKKQANW